LMQVLSQRRQAANMGDDLPGVSLSGVREIVGRMAWRLSGNPLSALMSWQKKALMLREIVLSIPELQKMSEAGIEHMEAMRAFNRGTITAEELMARVAS